MGKADDAATTRACAPGTWTGQGEDGRESLLAQAGAKGAVLAQGLQLLSRARPYGAGGLPQASGVIIITATASVPSSCAAALP